jgi:uncharacterized membrane protein YadS
MVKLARVTLLAPIVFALSLKTRLAADSAPVRSARPPVPWFVLGSITLVCVNSIIDVPADVRTMIATLTTFRLSVALASPSSTREDSAILGASASLYRELFSAPHQTCRMISS